MEMAYLSDIEAEIKDMNASYNIMISESMPHARIVYDMLPYTDTVPK